MSVSVLLIKYAICVRICIVWAEEDMPLEYDYIRLSVKQKVEDYSDFAIATSSFQELVQNSQIFIDNSLFIETAFNSLDNIPVLMMCPRKWGKSTNLDMLKMFIEMAVDKDGKEVYFDEPSTIHKLFVNGEITLNDGRIQKLESRLMIAENQAMISQHLSKYPVVYVSFKNATGKDYQTVENKLRAIVSGAFKRHKYMIKAFHKHIKNKEEPEYYFWNEDNLKKFESYLHPNETTNIEDGLNFLCKVLLKHFVKPVYVFIDDYDAPIYGFLRYDKSSDKDVEDSLKLVNGMLGNIFYDEGSAYFGLVTGRFHLDDVNWPSQKVITYPILNDVNLQDYFGFEQETVKFLFTKNHINETLSSYAQKWYGGYKEKDNRYHTLSMVKFLKTKQLENYYEEDNDDLIYKAIKLQPEFRSTVLSLISKENVTAAELKTIKLDEFIELRRILRGESSERVRRILLNYLLGEGYLLQFIVYAQVRTPENEHFHLKIPNSQVAFMMTKWMLKFYKQEYYIKEDLLESAAIALRDIIGSEFAATKPLSESLQALYCHSVGTRRKKQLNDFVQPIFNSVALQMQSNSKFDIDVFYNKTSKAGVSMVNNGTSIGVLVEVSYEQSAESTCRSAMENKLLFRQFTNLAYLKYVGVDVRSNCSVEILTKMKERMV